MTNSIIFSRYEESQRGLALNQSVQLSRLGKTLGPVHCCVD